MTRVSSCYAAVSHASWSAAGRLELAHFAHEGSWTVRVLFAPPLDALPQLAGTLRAVLRRDGSTPALRIRIEPERETQLDLDELAR